MECGEYFAASEIYRKTQNRISSKKQKKLKGEVNFKLGECYSNANFYSKAVRAYTQAIRYKFNDSIVYLKAAQSQLIEGKYKDAQRNFKTFLINKPNHVVAKNGLMTSENALILQKSKTRYKIKESKEFNARRSSSFCPIFMSDDASSIILTSNRDNTTSRKSNPITGVANNDIFTTRKNNSGKWENIEPINGTINTDEDEGVVSVTADGKTIYFTRCEGKNVAGQIFSSNRSGGEWTDPTLVTIFNDSSITCGHPAISPNGEKLYFVSDVAGGEGGKDLWVATNDNGKWVAPTNLGAQINTSGDEMFPYVRKDGKLFFASDGHYGLGGLDIFMATLDSNNVWNVENLLSPINSIYDDFGITFNKDNNEGYFSSNRNQRKPIDKIYSFTLPELIYQIEGNVVDDKGEALGESIIRLVGDNGENVKARTKKDGSFTMKLSLNTNYVMMASHRGYLNASHSLNTNDLNDSKIYNNVFKLVSISKPVKMDNIFYEFGKWTLTQDSEAGLQSLVKLLQDNPNIAMEISAHTDMIGNEKSNKELSQKRAQSVVDYLTNDGIDAKRITPKGYGESSPVIVDADLAKKHSFLKEGDILSSEFIEKLTDEQKNVCNQINRRTEFKVTKTTYNLF